MHGECLRVWRVLLEGSTRVKNNRTSCTGNISNFTQCCTSNPVLLDPLANTRFHYPDVSSNFTDGTRLSPRSHCRVGGQLFEAKVALSGSRELPRPSPKSSNAQTALVLTTYKQS